MVRSIEKELLQSLRDIIHAHTDSTQEPKQRMHAILTDLYQFLEENSEICAALLSPNGDIAFLRNIEKMIREKGVQTLRSFAPRELREQDLQYAISFALAGCMGLIEHWLKNGCPETPTHMAELTLVLLREGTTSIGVPELAPHVLH